MFLRQPKILNRLCCLLTSFVFFISTVYPAGLSYAQTIPTLPTPGTFIPVTTVFTPVQIKGLTVNPDNPLQFEFIIDQGDESISNDTLKETSTNLVKYFLASLTTPEQEMWVNLSPYEKNRIISNSLGQTEMGRDLLAQDYILKQLTSSLMHPKEDLGEAFWSKVHQQAYQRFGTTTIPTDTFNKVWIVPDQATVYEHNQSAFVVESRLKVMLEEDYMAISHQPSAISQNNQSLSTDSRSLTATLIKEVIIPAIEEEVNTGKNFANLRQIYNAMILASWYKDNLKDSLLGQIYVNKAKTKGLNPTDPAINQKIYQQYLEAFQKGTHDLIKEDYNPNTKEITPRKYFSGGAEMNVTRVRQDINRFDDLDAAQLAALPKGNEFIATFNLLEDTTKEDVDRAMLIDLTDFTWLSTRNGDPITENDLESIREAVALRLVPIKASNLTVQLVSPNGNASPVNVRIDRNDFVVSIDSGTSAFHFREGLVRAFLSDYRRFIWFLPEYFLDDNRSGRYIPEHLRQKHLMEEMVEKLVHPLVIRSFASFFEIQGARRNKFLFITPEQFKEALEILTVPEIFSYLIAEEKNIRRRVHRVTRFLFEAVKEREITLAQISSPIPDYTVFRAFSAIPTFRIPSAPNAKERKVVLDILFGEAAEEVRFMRNSSFPQEFREEALALMRTKLRHHFVIETLERFLIEIRMDDRVRTGFPFSAEGFMWVLNVLARPAVLDSLTLDNGYNKTENTIVTRRTWHLTNFLFNTLRDSQVRQEVDVLLLNEDIDFSRKIVNAQGEDISLFKVLDKFPVTVPLRNGRVPHVWTDEQMAEAISSLRYLVETTSLKDAKASTDKAILTSTNSFQTITQKYVIEAAFYADEPLDRFTPMVEFHDNPDWTVQKVLLDENKEQGTVGLTEMVIRDRETDRVLRVLRFPGNIILWLAAGFNAASPQQSFLDPRRYKQPNGWSVDGVPLDENGHARAIWDMDFGWRVLETFGFQVVNDQAMTEEQVSVILGDPDLTEAFMYAIDEVKASYEDEGQEFPYSQEDILIVAEMMTIKSIVDYVREHDTEFKKGTSHVVELLLRTRRNGFTKETMEKAIARKGSFGTYLLLVLQSFSRVKAGEARPSDEENEAIRTLFADGEISKSSDQAMIAFANQFEPKEDRLKGEPTRLEVINIFRRSNSIPNEIRDRIPLIVKTSRDNSLVLVAFLKFVVNMADRFRDSGRDFPISADKLIRVLQIMNLDEVFEAITTEQGEPLDYSVVEKRMEAVAYFLFFIDTDIMNKARVQTIFRHRENWEHLVNLMGYFLNLHNRGGGLTEEMVKDTILELQDKAAESGFSTQDAQDKAMASAGQAASTKIAIEEKIRREGPSKTKIVQSIIKMLGIDIAEIFFQMSKALQERQAEEGSSGFSSQDIIEVAQMLAEPKLLAYLNDREENFENFFRIKVSAIVLELFQARARGLASDEFNQYAANPSFYLLPDKREREKGHILLFMRSLPVMRPDVMREITTKIHDPLAQAALVFFFNKIVKGNGEEIPYSLETVSGMVEAVVRMGPLSSSKSFQRVVEEINKMELNGTIDAQTYETFKDYVESAEAQIKAVIQPFLYPVQQESARKVDSAITTEPVGGIDLNRSMLNLKIRRDARGVPVKMNPTEIMKINVEGFYPVLINIAPINVQALPMLLGSGEVPVDSEGSVPSGLSKVDAKIREKG